MKLFFDLALALLLVGSATAFECTNLGQDCTYVKESNLSSAEKDSIVSTLIYSADEPDYELIRNWNLGLKVVNAPDNVLTHDAGYIRHAWLRIFSVMPSVLYNGSLFAPQNTSIQTEYNYSVELPTSPQPGDCRTDYELVQNTANLGVYSNREYAGNSVLTTLSLHSDSIVESDLDINVVTRLYRYQMVYWCCGYYQCEVICSECRYSRTETKTDKLHLDDWVLVKYYNPTQYFQFNITDKYYGVTKAELEIENYSAFTLSTVNSNYTNNYYYYDLNWTYSPYNVLTIEAYDYETENINNLIVQNNASKYGFVLHNTEDCQIKLSDFFSGKVIPCDLSYAPNNTSQRVERKTDFGKYLQPLAYIGACLFLAYIIFSAAKKIKLDQF